MKIYDGQDFNAVIHDGNLVLVKFYATWCNPCKMLAPIVEAVDQKDNDLTTYEVDVDQFRNLAVEYKVKGVPTMILFKNGIEVDRVGGFFTRK